MRQKLLRYALALPAALIALGTLAPALADDHGGNSAEGAVQGQTEAGEGSGSGREVEPVLIWTTAGILAGSVLLSVLYLFKRRVGGFPRNPSWTAPITIMRSADAPDDSTFGTADPHAHGHHDAPAH
jgi:hypothetical protein